MLEIMEIQRDGMYKSVKALSNFKFHNWPIVIQKADLLLM
jgi:hypothetical protein